MDGLVQLLEGAPQAAEAGRVLGKVLVSEVFQGPELLEALLQLLFEFDVEGLRRGADVGVEILGRQLALFDGRLAGFELLAVAGAVGLVADGPGLAVLVPTVTAAGQGRPLQGVVEARTHPIQDAGPHVGIAVLQLGMERVPEPLHQLTDEVEAPAEPWDALFVDESFGEPGGELEVLAALGEGVAGELDHFGEVRLLDLVLPDALGEFFLLAAGFFDLVVDRLVAKILSARVVAGDRVEQIVAERHVGQDSAGRNSSFRTSR